MTRNKTIATAAISGIMALGLGSASGVFADEDKDEKTEKVEMEKCAGIVKKGMNDCGANGHGCGGMAKEDGDANEWIKLPKGTCDKIVGGKVVES